MGGTPKNSPFHRGEVNLKLIHVVLPFSIFLTGCSDPVLWQEGDDEAAGEYTRIKKIEFVRESCNKLTLNIAYYNDGTLPGYLRLSPNVGVKGQQWPHLPQMREGHHVMEVQNGFQSDAEPVTSTELSVAIEHIHENTWQGYVDRRTVEYQKDWDNECL